MRSLAAFYQFTRPHTMLGTFVSVISVSLLALQGAPVTALALKGMITALVPALLMNICIVGMNQLYDVEIDKVWPWSIMMGASCSLAIQPMPPALHGCWQICTSRCQSLNQLIFLALSSS